MASPIPLSGVETTQSPPVASFSSSMMENHIPASVLDASQKLSTLVGSDGTQFIFSIGDDQIFRVSVELDNGCAGWYTQDVASALQLQDDELVLKAKTFAVSINPSSGTITIALALTLPAGYDELYVATNLESSANPSWIANSGQEINWQNMVFDSQAFAKDKTITIQTLNIFDISLQSFWNENETAVPYVEVVDPSNELHRVFTVTISSSTVESNSTTWTYFPLATDSPGSLKIASGQPDPRVRQGIYWLGEQDGHATLDFVPEAGLTLSYTPVPEGSSAIASLVLPDLSSSESTITELYVASQNQLTIMKTGNRPSQQTVISNNPYINNTTVLHVSTNYGDQVVSPQDALVVVFGLNSVTDASENITHQVFYTYAVYEDRLDESAWAPVVIILDQVLAIATVINSVAGTLGFLGISASPSITSWITYAEKPPPSTLVSMVSNTATHTWQQHYVPVPVTNDYIRLRTYTTKLTISDPDTQLPLPKKDLNLTTIDNAILLVNGLSVRCIAGSPSSIQTDQSGCLSICNTISGIEALRYSISDTSGNQLVPAAAANDTSQSFDPASTVASTLINGAAGDLNSLTYQDGKGNNLPLVQSTDPDNLKNATAAFQGIQNHMPTSRTNQKGNALRARAVIAKRRQLVRQRASERAKLPEQRTGFDGNLDDSVEMLLSDLAQWIYTAAEDVTTLFISIAEEAVSLVVKFAEGFFHAIIETVEDAWNTIVSIFKWIGAEFENVFRWLAFIFNWKEMVYVHKGLVTAITTSIKTSAGQLDTIKSRLDGLLDNAKAKIAGDNPLSQMGSTFQNGVSSNGPTQGTGVKSNPQVGWVSDQIKNAQNASISNPSTSGAVRFVHLPASITSKDNDPTFASELANAGENAAGSGQSSQMGALLDSMNGNGSGGSAIWEAISSVGTTLIETVETGVDAAFQVTEGLETEALETLNATINIPVLSGLYTDLVESPPSILDITCLLAAIISTIGYNIVRSTDDSLPPLGDYVNSDGFQSMFQPQALHIGETSTASHNRLTLKDSDHSPALGVLGGLAVCKGFAILASAIGEDFELPEITSYATIVDNVCSILIGGIGAILEPNEDFADSIVVGVGLRAVILMALAQAAGKDPAGLSGTEAEQICTMSELVNTGLGFWALIDILSDLSEGAGNAEDWLDSLGDLLAFFGTVANLAKQEVIVSVISLLRTFASEGVGISFFNELTEKSENTRRLNTKAPTALEQKPTLSITEKLQPLTDSPVDATTLALTSLDMAFVLDETTANDIALYATQVQTLDIKFSYGADFNDSSSTNPAVYTCTGKLYFLYDTTTSISCGTVGSGVGSGVLWNYTLVNITVSVNGNSHSTDTNGEWIMPLVVQSYKTEQQATQYHTVEQQKDDMQSLYHTNMQISEFGLQIGNGLTPGPSTAAPPGWQSDDWLNFSKAIAKYLADSTGGLNTTVPLIQGVLPESPDSARWNLGPTDWRCFNLPALSTDYQGAVVFGFMVAGNSAPADPTTDFTNAALFSADTEDSPPNGLLFVSADLTTSAIKSNICSDQLLLSLAHVGLNVEPIDGQNQRMFWDSNSAAIATINSNSSWKPGMWGWYADGAGMYHFGEWDGNVGGRSKVETNTSNEIVLAYSTPENGFYQKLALDGQFTVSGCTSTCNWDPSFDYGNIGDQMPTVIFTCHVKALLNVSGNVVGWAYSQDSQSLSSDPDPDLNSPDALNFWTNEPQGQGLQKVLAPVQDPHSDRDRIGVVVGNMILDDDEGFCRPSKGTNAQVNLFAFPLGQTYQEAMLGVNQKYNLVVRLTYVIT